MGNTDKDPVRFASLIEDVSTKLFGRLPDSVWFYPGHGKDSTLGEQRASVPEWTGIVDDDKVPASERDAA